MEPHSKGKTGDLRSSSLTDEGESLFGDCIEHGGRHQKSCTCAKFLGILGILAFLKRFMNRFIIL